MERQLLTKNLLFTIFTTKLPATQTIQKVIVHPAKSLLVLFLPCWCFIRICATLENELSTEILGLDEKIHNIGINSIQNGQLKNDEMLDFIELDTYFSDRNKAKKNF